MLERVHFQRRMCCTRYMWLGMQRRLSYLAMPTTATTTAAAAAAAAAAASAASAAATTSFAAATSPNDSHGAHR